MSQTESAYGLGEISSPDNATVDIVFVHGLFGNRRSTWTSSSGNFWPKELLAKDYPQARIFTFGYDADVIATRADQEVTYGKIESHAVEICNGLVGIRGKLDRPIVFIAHSMGGLVCAKVIVSGATVSSEDNVAIVASQTRGIIFMATPIYGSDLAIWGNYLRKVLGIIQKTNPNHIKSLGDSEKLRELANTFSEALGKREAEGRKIGIAFMIEMLETEIFKLNKVWIVKEDSAWIPGRGDRSFVRANHKNICKFASKDDEGYKMVVGSIQKFLDMDVDSKPKGGPVFNARTIRNAVGGNVSGDMVAGDKFKGDKFRGDKVMGNKMAARGNDAEDDDDNDDGF
ncbi:unnamed protein product [Clonostachys chloroleuca]|uniref:DUF676 domain-containing protein n=1 Tax=Clonostachys chloroleuca TaxID=1926264 RepID=A0AA35VRY4_9HYPO|nr:unnamed protein product [Clonostachys chloroleuca]